MSVAAKLLRDVLLHNWHAIELFLTLSRRIHFIVFAEMLNVFGMGQVLFARICCVQSQYKFQRLSFQYLIENLLSS